MIETDDPKRVKRFFEKVEKHSSGHWFWNGALDKRGYGNFAVAKNKIGKAHRFSFKLHFGYIADSLQVHHRCEIYNCVAPKCLEQIEGVLNNELSSSPSAINKRKTECIRGHRFTKENTYFRKDGSRECKICRNERKKN